MKYRTKNSHGQRGATIVESAIVVLLLFTLLLSTVEFGRALNIYQTVTNAVREGARFSVAPAPGTDSLPTVDEVRARVCFFVESANLNCDSASINVTQSDAQQINGVNTVFTRVELAQPYQFFFLPFGEINLRSEAVMRNETN